MEAIKDIITIGAKRYVGNGVGFIIEMVCKIHSVISELSAVDQNEKVCDKLAHLKEELQEELQNANVQLETLQNDVSTIKDMVNVLRSKSSAVFDWVEEQKKKGKAKAEHIFVEDVVRVSIAIINSVEKFQSGDPLEITRGVLDIISSAAHLVGKPYGYVIGGLCSIISTILTKSNPQQPSVVDQLAKVVYGELVHFNKRLQYQKYEGLIRRVSDQNYQLRMMKPGEKLDDLNLWNDYVQLMGELSNRFESPLPFQYQNNLTRDPDVADFVTAVVTYCEAYCCFMALLIAAKGKFAELGGEYKKDEDAVDRKISCQTEDAKKKLSFLSEGRYLTFLGRLPYEGGKLTKIVALTRNMRGKNMVEAVRDSLDLTKMQGLAAVETAASIVARQSVKGKVEGHQIVPEWNWLLLSLVTGPKYLVQFINETTFPMKIVRAVIPPWVGSVQSVQSVQDVHPRESYLAPSSEFHSACGYIILYLNRILSSDTEPPAGNARVIEFAFSRNFINIQDKTTDEFTCGQDTLDKMLLMYWCGNAKTLYWFENGVHFMMRGEIVYKGYYYVFRFVVQDFDPCTVENLIMM